MNAEIENYFNMIEGDISGLSIKRDDMFNCLLTDTTGRTYKGFLLAISPQGNSFTLCDIDFHKSATDDKYQPRIIFRRTNEELVDSKVRANAIYQRISFDKGQDGYREFWKMLAFLHKFKDFVDLGDFENNYEVVSTEAFIMQFNDRDEATRVKELATLFKDGNITEQNIENAKENLKKNTLDTFNKLLNDPEYLTVYREKFEEEILGRGEEATWHHFLKNHDWLLGLNVDIRFIRDFLPESDVGIADTTGSTSPKVDMLGISDYTVLVELKTSNTNIFTENKKSTGRANTWSFTDDFIDGISQCLAQKTDWEKSHSTKKLIGNDKEVINQDCVRTVDPASIFIIGNKTKELPFETQDLDIHIKRDTLQRFRRNSRNVEIVTYDELYERAYYIVYDVKPGLIRQEEDEISFEEALEAVEIESAEKEAHFNNKKEKQEFDELLDNANDPKYQFKDSEDYNDKSDLEEANQTDDDLPF